MSKESKKIKTILKYLNRVSKSEEMGLMDQDFFLTTEELKGLIDNYYLGFDNQKELNDGLRFKLNSISELKFKEGEFSRVRDLSNNARVKYTTEEHQAYAFTVWHFLINEFETKLKLKKKKNKKAPIKINNVEVHNLFKLIDNEFKIFSSGEDFINAIAEERKQDFHLNIDNRTFRYIISVLEPYFDNWEHKKFIKSNNIYSNGRYSKVNTLITSKNYYRSECQDPEVMKSVDKIVKKFKNSLD